MKLNEVLTLADDIRDLIFHRLDQEFEMNAGECGTIAAKVEVLVAAELKKIFDIAE